MRKNFGAKTWVYPMPVFIISSYDENKKPNAMNAAWGGISEEHQISICISNDHKTTENILKSKAFCVSIATSKTVAPCDYVGIVSGNDENQKMEKAGFTFTNSEKVNAPIINELPMALECKLISYNKDTCTLIGDIVNVSCDEEYLDENNKIDINKVEPITYDPVYHKYIKLGEVVGNAFKDGLKLK